MADPFPPEEPERHARCRNLVWEPSPDGRGGAPGRYCVNRLGAVHSMDCPVYQGLSCCLFDPRPEGEDPMVAGEERILEIRELLTVDYLRWIYWRRIDALRGSEPPVDGVAAPPHEEEIAASLEAEVESEVVVRRELPEPPEPKEEALKEKYPGQRRSEDRRRSRSAPEAGDPDPEEDDFTRGIFDLPELDSESGSEDAGETVLPTPETAPEDASEPDGGSLPEKDRSDGEAGDGEDAGKRRPRRRNRRRRGRRRGSGSSGRKPST